MQDDQLNQQGIRPAPTYNVKRTPSIMKQHSYDEMEKNCIQGLCFNCDEKFTPGYKYKGPRLLLLEGNQEDKEGASDDP